MAGKEPFMPDHKWLLDQTLLNLPEVALTPLTLFVCTYVAKLGNLHLNVVDLTAEICVNPHGALVAINSNYGHACQPQYAHLLKKPHPPLRRLALQRGHVRKVQGDGTCFNSAIEPILVIEHPGISSEKVYKLKCFPSTGETQVPGVICPDLSDGQVVLRAFVKYLNELEVGDLNADGTRKSIEILTEQPKMLNYKFRVIRSTPRMLINLRAIAMYMQHLEYTTAPLAAWVVVDPPYHVRETKPPMDDVKVSFRFRGDTRAPRINIFQEGKINILGAESVESAQRIYDFFTQLFLTNWHVFINLQPRRDIDRVHVPAFVAVPPLTDADIESIIPFLADVDINADITDVEAILADAMTDWDDDSTESDVL